MIPHIIRLRIRRPSHRAIRLWIPVLPVLILLSPLFLLAAVAATITYLVMRINPVRAFVALGRVLRSARGTRIEIDLPEAQVSIDIR